MNSENKQNNDSSSVDRDIELLDAIPVTNAKRRYPWAMIVVIFLFIFIPFLSWYGSWFGRPLSDEKIQQYLTDKEKPRNVQHALSYIGNKIIEGDQSVQRWYPLIVATAKNEAPQVRKMAAWTMGQDNQSQEFHQSLLELLQDANAGVRHNAALQLVRFNDPSGRKELLAMLESQTLRAETDGEIELLISEEGRAISENTPLARIKKADGQIVEVRSTDDARIQAILVADKSTVKIGDELITIAPSVEQAFETLKALYLVGQTEDIPAIQRYTGQMTGMSDAVRQQALNTLEAIRKRNGR
ncbi:MAG: HEAT repeat domain-containing protein [Acidobacteriota bacterium]